MAKRARARSPSWHKDPDAIIEEPAREITDLLETLNKIDKEVVYVPVGPIQMSALLVGGGYKTAPIAGDTEMTFIGARMGKRGKIIFEFAPVEPGEFKQLEMDEGRISAAFPDFEWTAKRATGANDDQCQAHSFSELAGAYTANLRRTREREAVKARQEAERSEQEHYSDHPDWGLF